MELLRSWVNDELKLSRSVSSFEVDMANGYLIGEILVRHGLLPGHAPLDSLQDKESPNAKISNFGMVQQALLDLARALVDEGEQRPEHRRAEPLDRVGGARGGVRLERRPGPGLHRGGPAAAGGCRWGAANRA